VLGGGAYFLDAGVARGDNRVEFITGLAKLKRELQM